MTAHRTWIALLTGGALVVGFATTPGCNREDAENSVAEAAEELAETVSPEDSEAEPDPNEPTEDEIPVPEDFAEKATAEVGEDDLEAAVEAIEKEIEADEGDQG